MIWSQHMNSNQKPYISEAKNRWGNTETYKGYEKRGDISADIIVLFRELGEVYYLLPEDAVVQTLVAKL